MNDSANASSIEPEQNLLEEKRAIARGEINDKREIFGWKIYDWANSAFYTTVVGALFGPYLTDVTQRAVGENGVVMAFGPLGPITAKSFFPTCVSVAVFLQIFLLPTMGA